MYTQHHTHHIIRFVAKKNYKIHNSACRLPFFHSFFMLFSVLLRFYFFLFFCVFQQFLFLVKNIKQKKMISLIFSFFFYFYFSFSFHLLFNILFYYILYLYFFLQYVCVFVIVIVLCVIFTFFLVFNFSCLVKFYKKKITKKL